MIVTGHFRDWMLLEDEFNIAKYSNQGTEAGNIISKCIFKGKTNRIGSPSILLVEFFGMKILFRMEEEGIIDIEDIIEHKKFDKELDLYAYVFSKLV